MTAPRRALWITIALLAVAGVAILAATMFGPEESPPVTPPAPPASIDVAPPRTVERPAPLDPDVAPQPAAPRIDRSTGDSGLIGRILSPAGNPIADAAVTLYRAADKDALGIGKRVLVREALLTDRDGLFAFPQIPAASDYLVRVEHGKYATAERGRIDLPRGSSATIPDITLANGLAVRGTVSARDGGQPIEGARVVLIGDVSGDAMIEEGGLPQRVVLTDDKGRYLLPHLAPTRYRIEVAADGFESGVAAHVSLDLSGNDVTQDFQLGRGIVIAGRVVDHHGEPVAGARVEARRTKGGLPTVVAALTAEDGRYRIMGAGEGLYRVAAAKTGYKAGLLLDVEAGSETARFRLQKFTGITGFVRDGRTGDPVRSFGIIVWRVGKQEAPGLEAQELTRFDAPDGSFTVENLSPGQYRVQGFANGFGPTWSEPFTVRDVFVHGIVVDMQPGAALTGEVVDADGSPIAGARVRALTNNYRDMPMSDLLFGSYSQVAAPVRTGDDGRFTIENLEEATLQLEVKAKDRCTLYVRDVVVRNGQVNDCGALRMRVGGELHGTVIFDDNAPARLATVVLVGPQGDMRETQADSDGRYAIPNVLPGEYQVSAQRMTDSTSVADAVKGAGDRMHSMRTVTVAEGQSQLLTLVVKGR